MDVKFISTTSTRLPDVPFLNGQIIYVSDKADTYYDLGNARHRLSNVAILNEYPQDTSELELEMLYVILDEDSNIQIGILDPNTHQFKVISGYIATSSSVGLVRPDNTSIIIDDEGVISAQAVTSMPARSVTYDNTSSGFEGSNVQDVLDEIDANFTNIEVIATTAQANAQAAETISATARRAAQSAEDSADRATRAAQSASTAASQAQTTADSALLAANSVIDTANAANTLAQSALQMSSSAVSTAQSAQQAIEDFGSNPPVASTDSFGMIKVDGLSITIDGNGKVHAAVTSVNGKTGQVQLHAADVHALPEDTTYVSSVNGKTGAPVLTALDVSALPATTTLADISQDATHRTVTDTQISTWNAKSDFSGRYPDLTDKPAIPTVTSDLTNDSGFITKIVSDLVNYYTKTEVDSLVATVSGMHFEVVAQLPTSGIQTNAIYLVPSSSSTAQNAKDEYINLDGTSAGWELIGITTVDLSNYVTVTALNAALANYTTTGDLATLLAGKQDTLTFTSAPSSSNKVVTEDDLPTPGDTVVVTQIKSTGEKIAQISVNGTTTDLYASASGGGSGAVDSVNGQTGHVTLTTDDISDTNATNKYVTALDKAAWNAKQDALTFTSSPSAVNRVVTEDDLPAVPTALSQLTEDSTHRVVTDTEKTAWNNKADTSAIPTTLSELTGDASHRTVTDAQITSWNAKADTSSIPTALSDLSSDSMHRLVTDAEKSAWDSKADVSNIPTALSELSSDSTHRLVTDAQKSDWNAKSTVSFMQTLSSGTEIGEITIDGTSVKLYCTSSTSVTSVNGQIGVVTLTAADVSALPVGITLANIAGDSTHRTVTDTQISTWNGKQDALAFTSTPSASNKVVTVDDLPLTVITGLSMTTATYTVNNAAITASSLIDVYYADNYNIDPTYTQAVGSFTITLPEAPASAISFSVKIVN